MNQNRRTTLALIISLTLDLIAFASILPLFPSIIDFYALDDHRDWLYTLFESASIWLQELTGMPNLKRYNSVIFGGLLGSLFSLLQFISSPILGALSDIYGRKNILILSIIGTLLSHAVWCKANLFSIFVLSRIIGGLSKANTSISVAVVADIYPAKTIAKGMALIGASFSLGFIIGPMFGAYISHVMKIKQTNSLFSNITPAQFALFVTIIELIIVVTLLSETLDPSKRGKHFASDYRMYISPRSLFNFAAVSKVMRPDDLSRMKWYGMINFIFLYVYSGLEFTITFLTHIRFEYNSMQQGRMYLYIGIIMMILQGGVLRRIPSDKHLIAAFYATAILIPAYTIIAFANSFIPLYIGLTMYSVASAIVVPCITSCVSNLASKSTKGASLGVFRCLGALARALGPISFAALFWIMGPMMCYLLGAFLFTIPCIMLRLNA